MENSYSNIFRQPKAFYVIFMLEIWERLLNAGIMSIIAIFLMKKFGMNEMDSANITGSFGALCYAFIVIGGELGDKWFGIKRSILLGLIFILCGFLALYYVEYHIDNSHVINHDLIYFCLAFYIIGMSLFKPNPSNLLSLYYPQNTDLDSVYTYYYMAINVGSLIGASIIPVVIVKYGYLYGITILIIAALIAIACYIIGYPIIKNKDNQVGNTKLSLSKIIISLIGTSVILYITGEMLKYNTLASWFLYSLFFISVIYFIHLIKSAPTPSDRSKIIVALVLILQYMLFFILFIQLFSSLTFFGLSNCNLSLGPITFNEQQFAIFDGLSVVVLSPLLAFWYKKHDDDHAYVTKFSLGNIALGLSFIVLYVSTFFADSKSHVNVIWVLFAFVIFAGGELLISAVGLSMIADLINKSNRGFAYGFWFITGALGMKIGGKIAGIFTIPEGVTNPAVTLHIFSNLFLLLGGVVTSIGLITCIFIPKLKSMLRYSK